MLQISEQDPALAKQRSLLTHVGHLYRILMQGGLSLPGFLKSGGNGLLTVNTIVNDLIGCLDNTSGTHQEARPLLTEAVGR